MARETALITGASAGIGAEFARQLAAEGMDLVVVARRMEALEALKKEVEGRHGIRCEVLARDLSNLDAPAAIHAETQRRRIAVDWLVNNAGFGTNGRFAELGFEREMEEVRLNVLSLVALTRLYLPDMISRRRGQIVNVGSVGSFVPVPYMATYGATKAFVLSFSEALATELNGSGVRVLALCPGATRTEFQKVAGVEGRVPDARYMSAAEVARQAIAAARRGDRALVPSVMNKIAAILPRFLPRRTQAWIAGSMYRPR